MRPSVACLAAILALVPQARADAQGQAATGASRTAPPPGAAPSAPTAAPGPGKALASKSLAPATETRVTHLLLEAEKKDLSRDFDGAIVQLQDALDLRPQGELLFRIWRGLGFAYARVGEPEKARKYLELYLPHAQDREEKILVAEILVRSGLE